MASRTFTKAEVQQHNREDDCWIIVDNVVYDITNFLSFHPGGKLILLRFAGKDASKEFHALHGEAVLRKYGPKLRKGVLASPAAAPGMDDVAFADPYWYNPNLKSPYYTADHHAFRQRVRDFVDREMIPFVQEWAGVYGASWPAQYGGTPPKGWDAFMDFILLDELARCGAGGVLASCFFSANIALPPILKVGSDYLKDKVARDVITGRKILALAVSEPHAGSDVASLQTVAVRDGDYYIVNGEKKFITSGMKAHYYTTAVRTGGSKHGGVSLLLIEKEMEGVTVRRQRTQGWWSSNTAYITFENVKVPVKNLIGKENEGFKPIMVNFNHERWALAVMSNRYSRICIEDAVRFARVRKTFNKRLIDHQVIRHKIAEMSRLVESTHAMLEQLAYQMQCGVSDRYTASGIALVKVQATKVYEFCARESSQILGGNSFIRGGHGERVERLYREVRVNAIGGGSEEILLDLAMRQSKL